jgi:hypothetical protein
MPKIKNKCSWSRKQSKEAAEAESKSIFGKICASSCCKKGLFHHCKATTATTPSGLTYKIVQKNRYKTIDGSTFIFTMPVILKTEAYLTVAMKT